MPPSSEQHTDKQSPEQNDQEQVQGEQISDDLERLRREVERLKNEEAEFEKERQIAEEESRLVEERIFALQDDVKNAHKRYITRPEEPSTARTWRWNSTGKGLDGFTLTDLRQDVMFRLRHPEQLYTLEECKLLLREVIRTIQSHAKQDIENLMFLTKLRSEKLFPKPIVQKYLRCGQAGAAVEELSGWMDTQEEHHLIYTEEGMRRIVSRLMPQEKDDNDDGDDIYEYENEQTTRTEAHDDSRETEDRVMSDSCRAAKDELSNITAARKARLQALVVEVNRSLVKMIDSSLNQRKERLLLAATILREIEEFVAHKDTLPMEIL